MAQGFDFTAAMRSVCGDMTNRLPELSHIDMSRVAVGYRQTRRAVSHGLQASLTPLRFEGGAAIGKVKGRRYACSRVFNRQGKESLYVLNFYCPRFFDHALEEKLTTVTHELWHISPKMDGDIRRHEGRCFAHGHSQEDYDAHAAALAREWLASNPPAGLVDFLDQSFAELVAAHGRVVGDRYSPAKLIKVA